MSFDSLRAKITENINENVFYIWEIEKIVQNLGGTYTQSTIRNHLKNDRLMVERGSVDPVQHGVRDSPFFYLQSKVWDYLQRLEEKGKIQLKQRDIESMEEITEREYHKYMLGYGGVEGRRHGRIPPKETSGSWDNVIKIYEGN